MTGACLIALAVAVSTSQDAWLGKSQDVCRSVFEKFHQPVFLDLDGTTLPYGRLAEQRIETERAVALWASSYGRTAKTSAGGWLLVRGGSIEAMAGFNDRPRLLKWFEEYGVADLPQLMGQPGSYESISDTGQRVLGRLSSGNEGVARLILEGAPLAVQMHPVINIRYKVEGSDQPQSFGLWPQSAYASYESAKTDGFQGASTEELRPAQPVEDGELKLEDGEVMLVRDLRRRIREVFDIDVVIDERLQNEYVFLKGSFTKERIIALIRSYVAGPAFAVVEGGDAAQLAQLEQLENQLLGKLVESLDSSSGGIAELARKLLSGEATSASVSDLRRLFPDYDKYAKSFNLPESGEVDLQLSIGIRMFGSGTTDSTASSASINGQAVRVMVPNDLRFNMIKK